MKFCIPPLFIDCKDNGNTRRKFNQRNCWTFVAHHFVFKSKKND